MFSSSHHFTEQDKLLEEKKKMFLARKVGNTPNPQYSDKSPSGNRSEKCNNIPRKKKKSKSITTQNESTPTKKSKPPSHLPFANDGSFYENFIRTQHHSQTDAVPPINQSTISHIMSPYTIQHSYTDSIPLEASNFQNSTNESSQQVDGIDSTISKSHITIHFRDNAVKQSNDAPVSNPRVFTSLNDLDYSINNKNSSNSKIDKEGLREPSQFELADRLAKLISSEDEQSEKKLIEKYAKQEEYDFISDKHSPAYLYFHQKTIEYRGDINRSYQPTAELIEFKSQHRKRSRFEESSPSVYPSNVVVKQETEVDSRTSKKEQVESQRQLNIIADDIREGHRAGKNKVFNKRVTGGVRYEYDSDEDNERGTWEHKRRAQEIERTRNLSQVLTISAKGKHHIGDFLPDDVFSNFMSDVENVNEISEKTERSDYKEHTIKEDNIGYKMLQKAGWEEGKGLGANQQGITQPINKGRHSLDTAGVGTASIGEVRRDDDPYVLYRKRMMLAYKFRPNPLNNPRRPYY